MGITKVIRVFILALRYNSGTKPALAACRTCRISLAETMQRKVAPLILLNTNIFGGHLVQVASVHSLAASMGARAGCINGLLKGHDFSRAA